MSARKILRGEISASNALLELIRRTQVKRNRRYERAILEKLSAQPPQLRPEFQTLAPAALLKHFLQRTSPVFFRGFEAAEPSTAEAYGRFFPDKIQALVELASLITNGHRWPLLGFGEKHFGESIDWHRDPLSGRNWPLDFHADIALWHNDGSDIRVLWEFNRLGHLLTLGRAYVLTSNEQFAEEFFQQLESWQAQNPVGRGANWCCAMEVALRAMNIFGTLALFRRSSRLTADRLLSMFGLLEQHGAHIRRNIEFSYIATGNHYLSDVAGLLWLGIMLPELSAAAEWREWALRQMLRELEKQVLADGADFESSTGYHRLVLELFLFSFILCQANGQIIEGKYWKKLESMLVYLKGYLRPDGSAPLIGDSDSGQAFPIVPHAANDHSYLLALGSVLFKNSDLKPAGLPPPEELLWIFGEQGVKEYQAMASSAAVHSAAFPQSGTFVMRDGDRYLFFNASGAGGNGRGSHGHNDSLSLEVFACGRAFIVDPGSYLYTADLHERHLFRSTAYHSTLQVDGVEQNSTTEVVPFVIGDEAHPRVLRWETTSGRDVLVAEQHGYRRLSKPVTHRRTVLFDKSAHCWMVEDELQGSGDHDVKVRFHFDAGLEVQVQSRSIVVACDKISEARLFVCSLDQHGDLELEDQFVSREYGFKQPSVSACWSTRISGAIKLRWVLVPVCADQNEHERLKLSMRVANES